jgi:archaellum component FlaF (FlaF/FlaG flagellin family)
MTIFLVIFSILFNANYVFASPNIVSFLLNGDSKSVAFNPNIGESISIEVKANTPVKFTRLYICSITQLCTGSKGEYTRYFTSNSISESITKVWNGKISSDASSGFVPSGEYKVMVSMNDGVNDPIIEFGQYSIFVDFSSQSQTVPPSSEDSVVEPNTSTAASNNAISGDISLHSSEEGLSDYNDGSSPFEVSAGRERVTYIGVPVEFVAKYKIDKSIEGRSPNFSWSFGDGTSMNGEKVVHSYKFLGEYDVVLNAEIGDEKSVSRTSVKVLSPDVLINILSNGDIELKNKGKTEINLGGWVVSNLSSRFVFPRDTIVGSGKIIILSKDDTKIIVNSGELLRLINPTGGEVVSIRQNNNSVPENLIKNSQTIDDILGISQEKAEVLVANYKKSLVEKSIVKNEEKVVVLPDKKGDDRESTIQNASVAESVVFGSSTPSSGFWNNFVGRGFKSFARIFYDF